MRQTSARADFGLRAHAAQLGEVSHQAVCDVLRVLTGAGLVRRIQPTGSVARYEAWIGDNHTVHRGLCPVCSTARRS
jgi:Fur family transcriptional regulator, stress-responsive regulator